MLALIHLNVFLTKGVLRTILAWLGYSAINIALQFTELWIQREELTVKLTSSWPKKGQLRELPEYIQIVMWSRFLFANLIWTSVTDLFLTYF